MRAQPILLLVSALCTGFLAGCSTSPFENEVSGTDIRTLSIAIALPATMSDTPSTAIAVVSAPDMDTIKQNLTIEKSRVCGTIEKIPLGSKRHVEIMIYNNQGLMIYYGDAYAEVLSAKAVSIAITLKPVKGSIVINGTIEDDSHTSCAFAIDKGTVFLTWFDKNVKDMVSGTQGKLAEGIFVNALFGQGIKLDPSSGTKAICRFPASTSINLTTGSMEALCYADGITNNFMHIIDKSWLYGITAYNGKLALNFGQGWWYSSVPIPLKKWSYICGTFNGTTIQLYLNGELIESASYFGFRGDSSFDLGIGNAAADSHNVPFYGIIDEIRLSKVVRSASEIATTWVGIEKKLR